MKTIKQYLFAAFGQIILIFTFLISTQNTYGQSWSSIGSGGMNDWAYASTVYNGDLIVGGKFTSVGGVSANYIARWDGTNWYPLGLGVNAKVWALTTYNGDLYAGGEFTEAGGQPMLYIAKWDGTQWLNSLGDMGSIVTSFAVFNNKLIVGGYFVEADGLPVNNIAEYSSLNGWAALGTGVVGTQGTVMALEVHNAELIAAGFFTAAGGIAANHIAKWDGTTWSALGSGISNIVYTLTNYNSNLIAGGLFITAGGVTCNHIASWDGTSWSALGTGMSGIFYQYVFALKVYNGNLIAGGYFTNSGGALTNGIAKWDGFTWSDLNGGLFEPGNVCGTHTLCLYGNDLIVGGLFSSAGSASNTTNVASWNETQTGLNSTTFLKAAQNLKMQPNPFSKTAWINYHLIKDGTIKLSLEDVAGKEIKVLVNEFKTSGDYQYELTDYQLNPGTYFIRLKENNKNETMKIIKIQ